MTCQNALKKKFTRVQKQYKYLHVLMSIHVFITTPEVLGDKKLSFSILSEVS